MDDAEGSMVVGESERGDVRADDVSSPPVLVDELATVLRQRRGRRLSPGVSLDVSPRAPKDGAPAVQRVVGRRLLGRVSSLTVVLAGDLAAVVVTGLSTGHWAVSLVLGVVVFAAFATNRGYAPRLTMSLLDALPSLTGRVLGAAGVVVAAMLLLAGPARARSAAVSGIVLFAAIILARTLCYAAVRRVRRSELVSHPTVVIGAGRVGGQIAQSLKDYGEFGLRPVGFLDNDPLLRPEERPVPLLGPTTRLAGIIRDRGIRCVIVAFANASESDMIDVIRTCDRLSCEIFFVPRLFELHNTSHDVDSIRGVPIARLRRPAFRSWSWRFKRAMDIVVSAAALVALSPLLALTALAVRRDSGPGVIFHQERVALDGRTFRLLKFRSMRPVDEVESGTRWSIAHDERVTQVGRLMRATSIDELPQLWNVLRGDMSLVGPRPERPHFVREFGQAFPRYQDRHRVPAGVTGWAQINGLRGDTSIAERASFDNQYIENWSLWMDVKILLRTLATVLFARGA